MLEHSASLIKVINGEILTAASCDVSIFNSELKLVKCLCNHESIPFCIDGNAKYIAVGYEDGRVGFFTRKDDREPNVSKRLVVK